MNYKEYSDETINHIRQVELMILKDFIKICEENNIEYYSYGGTTLGAIRHGGFIPWDDDIDVIMFREEYEKFIEIMKSKPSDKYEILNMDVNDDYFFGFSKLSLKNTELKEFWSVKTSFNNGINIDIFVLDYVPSNKIKWKIYYEKCQFFKKWGLINQAITNDVYVSSFKRILGKTIETIFKIFNINKDKYKKFYKTLTKYDSTSEYVFDIGAVCYNNPYPKSIFKPIKKVKFEDIEINVPYDVDTYLSITYGENYMELPPIEERYNHQHEYIDFGKY